MTCSVIRSTDFALKSSARERSANSSRSRRRSHQLFFTQGVEDSHPRRRASSPRGGRPFGLPGTHFWTFPQRARGLGAQTWPTGAGREGPPLGPAGSGSPRCLAPAVSGSSGRRPAPSRPLLGARRQGNSVECGSAAERPCVTYVTACSRAHKRPHPRKPRSPLRGWTAAPIGSPEAPAHWALQGPSPPARLRRCPGNGGRRHLWQAVTHQSKKQKVTAGSASDLVSSHRLYVLETAVWSSALWFIHSYSWVL